MLKIKLARFGRRGQPHFRIVVNEARSKRDGQYMALLGQYVPAQQPKILQIDIKAFDEWLSKGAQPTDTVAALYKRFKSKDPFPPKKPRPSKKQLAKKVAQEKAKTVETPPSAPIEVETPPTK
ncbi:MAG: 30S ribosomal protein S16 [Patescibacteria group bacterium]